MLKRSAKQQIAGVAVNTDICYKWEHLIVLIKEIRIITCVNTNVLVCDNWKGLKRIIWEFYFMWNVRKVIEKKGNTKKKKNIIVNCENP